MQAASQQYGPACYYLGIMLLHGHGVPVNYEQALIWFKTALDTGDMTIVDKAHEAYMELKPLIEEAREEQEEAMAEFDVEGNNYNTRRPNPH